MNDLELIRLKDEQRVWIGHGTAGAFLEELPFECHLNRGSYLSVCHKERRGAVFPNEIFAVEGTLYYFGQPPRPRQPVRSCRLTWLGQGQADTPRPQVYPQFGIATLSALSSTLWLVLANLRDLWLQSKQESRPQRPVSTKLSTLVLVTLLSLPLAAHAPGPTLREQTDHMRHLALHTEMEIMRSETDRQNIASIKENPAPLPSLTDVPAPKTQEARPPSRPTSKSPSNSCRLALAAAHMLSEQSLYALRRRCGHLAQEQHP